MKSSQTYLPGALAGILLALCLVAPAVAQAPVIDEVTVASSTQSRLYSPTVAFSARGSVIAVWEDSKSGLEGRRVRPGGGLSPTVQLAANDLPPSIPYRGPITLQRDPVVVPLGGGDFLTIWKQESQEVNVDILYQESEVTESTIQVRRFNGAGSPIGRQSSLSDGDLGFEGAPEAVRLASGRVAAVWHTRSEGVPAGIYARLLGGRGIPHGTPFRIDEPGAEAGSRPVLAALADGGFMVAWQQCCDAGGDEDVMARRFDADGVAQGPPFVVNALTDGPQLWPALAEGVDGELMVAWMGPAAGEEGLEYRVYGQKLSADGTRIGNERALSSGRGRAHGAPTLAALPDGYALVWTQWLRSFLGGVYGVALDTDGAPRGDAVRVSQGPVQFQWDLALTSSPDGEVLAGWEGYSSPAGDPAINVWTLSPRP